MMATEDKSNLGGKEAGYALMTAGMAFRVKYRIDQKKFDTACKSEPLALT